MEYLEISRALTLIASFIITLGLYDQATRIFKTRSAKDFTWTIIVALAINELAWINYGFSLNEWPIILVGAMNVPGIILMIIGYLKFHDKT